MQGGKRLLLSLYPEGADHVHLSAQGSLEMKLTAKFGLLLSVALLGSAISTTVYADDDDKAELRKEHKAAFNDWHKNQKKSFERAWKAIAEAEGRARPVFEKGKALQKAGKAKKAVATYQKARLILLTGDDAALVPLQLGLAYEIALQLAEIYQETGRTAESMRETTLLREGRQWRSKKEERDLFMHNMVQQEVLVYYADQDKETRGRARPRADRRQTKRVLNYLAYRNDEGVYVFPKGGGIGKRFRETEEKIKRAHDYDTFKELGGERSTQIHADEYQPSSFSVNDDRPIFVDDVTVTKVKRRKATFDFRKSVEEGHNCKTTGRIRRVNQYGRRIYERKCDTRKVKGGHQMVLTLPKGLRLRKGDKVTLFGLVKSAEKKRGGKLTVKSSQIIHAARGKKVLFLLGVPTSRPTNRNQCTRRLVPSVGASDPLALNYSC